jgi:hypothetical protein
MKEVQEVMVEVAEVKLLVMVIVLDVIKVKEVV